jgi:zinc transporter ZupT
MFAASVYKLILPGLILTSNSIRINERLPVISGIILGAMFLWRTDKYLSIERLESKNWKKYGNKSQLLIFLARIIHSIPEGVVLV